MCLYKMDEDTSVIEFKKVSGDYTVYNDKAKQLQEKFLAILTEYNEKAKEEEGKEPKQQKEDDGEEGEEVKVEESKADD